MSLSNDQVGHIARLARIALSDTELDATRAKLNGIFELIEQMQAVDTTGVEPMSHPVPITNVFRTDEVRPGLTPDAALEGAPASEEQRFLVPKILGEE